MARRKARQGKIMDEATRRATFKRLLLELKKEVDDLSMNHNMDIVVIIISPEGQAICLSGGKCPEDVIIRFLKDTNADDPNNEEVIKGYEKMKYEREMAARLARENLVNPNQPMHSEMKNMAGHHGPGAMPTEEAKLTVDWNAVAPYMNGTYYFL